MKIAFYILLSVWLGGGLLLGVMGNSAGQAFFANLFGIPAIIIGVVLLVRKLTSKEPGNEVGTSDPDR